jgi:fatty acid desaturase
MTKAVNTSQADRRSDMVSFAAVAAHLVFVLTPVFLAAGTEPGVVHSGYWLWFGLSSHGLINLMHEAAHRLVFRRREGSDILGLWVLAPIFVTDFDAYRERHWIHHNKFGEDGDSKDAYLEDISHWKLLIFGLCCLVLGEAVRKFIGQFRLSGGGAEDARAPGLAALRFVIVQSLFAATLVLIGCATSSWDMAHGLFKGAVAYFGVYVYALGSLTVLVAALRAIAEHQLDGFGDIVEGRAALRNLSCNPFTRLIFGAYGFAEHATHHRWPGLPSYRLARVTRELAISEPRLAPRRGYIAILFALWLKRDAS